MLQDHRVDVLGQGAVRDEFAWPTPPVCPAPIPPMLRGVIATVTPAPSLLSA